jgi:serine/threonine-protein kinase RIO1
VAAVDETTRLQLFKWINAGVLDEVHGIVSTGKEAIVLHARGGALDEVDDPVYVGIPEECAIKVFKTTLNEYKTRDKYIRDDHRYKDQLSKLVSLEVFQNTVTLLSCLRSQREPTVNNVSKRTTRSDFHRFSN